MALVVAKHIELRTGCSIRKFIDEAKKVVDGDQSIACFRYAWCDYGDGFNKI